MSGDGNVIQLISLIKSDLIQLTSAPANIIPVVPLVVAAHDLSCLRRLARPDRLPHHRFPSLKSATIGFSNPYNKFESTIDCVWQ